MILIMMVIAGVLIFFCLKKPYLSFVSCMLVVSLGSLFNTIHPIFSYALQLILFIITLNAVIKKKLLNYVVVLYPIFLLLFILFQVSIVNMDTEKMFLSIYRLVFIPLFAYLSYMMLKKENKTLSDVISLYLLPNLAILYYRAFVDYSFFSILEDYSDTIYSSLYSFGGANYRPSNLHSPINFSVEVVVLLSVYFFEKGWDGKLQKMLLISALPILLMDSRTSFVLIIFAFVAYLAKEKKTAKRLASLLVFISISLISYIAVLGDDSIMRNLNFETRFNSINNLFTSFSSQSAINQLFGKGIGTTNLVLDNTGNLEVYVENYHLSVLYDLGIFLFISWLVFNAVAIFIFVRKQGVFEYSVIFAGLFIVNFLSSNLTSYNVQLIYLYILLKCIEGSNLFKKEVQNNAQKNRISRY